jgi:hypothetical protein
MNKTNEDFYAGAVIRVAGATIASRRIMASTYISTTAGVSLMRLRIETPLPDAIIDGAVTVTINNPTDNNSPKCHFFIPTGVNIDNFYSGYRLGITSTTPFTENFNVIESYDGVTRIATLVGVLDVATFAAAGNELILRRESPSTTGVVEVVSLSYNPAAFANSTTQVTLNGVIPAASVGAFIRITCVAFPNTFPTLNSVDIRRIITSTTRNIFTSTIAFAPKTVVTISI